MLVSPSGPGSADWTPASQSTQRPPILVHRDKNKTPEDKLSSLEDAARDNPVLGGAGSAAPPCGWPRDCRAASPSSSNPPVPPSPPPPPPLPHPSPPPCPQAFDALSRFPPDASFVTITDSGCSCLRAPGHPAGTASRWRRSHPHPSRSLCPGPQPRPAALWRRHSWSTAVLGDCFLSAAVIMGNFLSATQKLKPKQHREGSSRSWCTRQARGRGPGVEGRRSPQALGVRSSQNRLTGYKSPSLDAACSVLRWQRNLCPLEAAREGGEEGEATALARPPRRELLLF